MRSSEAYKPRLIFWEVTKGCNLRCIHCRATATELSSPLDLPTAKALDIIGEIAAYGSPILVLSGGEPLYRHDIFELARSAADRGLRVALATNGTMVTKDVARRIVNSGVKRVSISIDGADADTHDTFRGIPGAFDAAIRGLRYLKELGMSVQINMTVARHNVSQVADVLALARRVGADALHTFLLVPVGCGVEIADKQMVPPQQYEEILNWFYDQAQLGDIEMKATCAPHYFRVARQRYVAEKASGAKGNGNGHGIGPMDITMPGATGVALHPHLPKHAGGHPHGDPAAMNAMTKGCLAGTGVCFISHVGEVFPCGYLPALAGDLRTQHFKDVWEHAPVFADLRDTGKLQGKCGRCEFRNVCMGCRARAYAATGNYMDEEPFCIYEPRMTAAPARTH